MKASSSLRSTSSRSLFQRLTGTSSGAVGMPSRRAVSSGIAATGSTVPYFLSCGPTASETRVRPSEVRTRPCLAIIQRSGEVTGLRVLTAAPYRICQC